MSSSNNCWSAGDPYIVRCPKCKCSSFHNSWHGPVFGLVCANCGLEGQMGKDEKNRMFFAVTEGPYKNCEKINDTGEVPEVEKEGGAAREETIKNGGNLGSDEKADRG